MENSVVDAIFDNSGGNNHAVDHSIREAVDFPGGEVGNQPQETARETCSVTTRTTWCWTLSLSSTSKHFGIAVEACTKTDKSMVSSNRDERADRRMVCARRREQLQPLWARADKPPQSRQHLLPSTFNPGFVLPQSFRAITPTLPHYGEMRPSGS